MTLIDVFTVIVLILVSVLIIALIIYIGKITRSIEQMQKEMGQLSDNLNPLLSSLTDLTSKFSDLGDEARNQLETSKGIVYKVRDRVDTILGLEENIRTGIEGPVMRFINELKAISNGVSTFLHNLKK